MNENDPVWTKMKYRHIKDVSDDLGKELEEFKEKYESVAKIDRNERNTTLLEMNRAVKNVTAYNEEKLKVINIINKKINKLINFCYLFRFLFI